MFDNRLILKLAAFDVFAVFGAWYYAQWDFIKQLIDQAWAQRSRLTVLPRQIQLDEMAPTLLSVAACCIALLFVTRVRQRRLTRLAENMRRCRDASEHALSIERRLAASPILFRLTELRADEIRDDGAKSLFWRVRSGATKAP